MKSGENQNNIDFKIYLYNLYINMILHWVISRGIFALPLFKDSSNTQALHNELLLTKLHFSQCIFLGILANSLAFIYSALWIISIMQEGLTFSKSKKLKKINLPFISSLTWPLYALGA